MNQPIFGVCFGIIGIKQPPLSSLPLRRGLDMMEKAPSGEMIRYEKHMTFLRLVLFTLPVILFNMWQA